MSLSMKTWKVIFLWMLPCYRAGSDGIFECGEHGRFEYCIDDIPGCVIGCHCHPGYYFDTDTKICEPNTKLTSNYRHRYNPEPIRVQNPTFLPDVPQTESLPTLTTHNIIDKHVDDITKNANDLGDWLYNQFFKTIENEVINNTNKDSQLTRRSGRGSMPKLKKLKRRPKRKGGNHKKQKKSKQEKLLRISEDDSLFQSSDSSYSESSDSDFSQSYSSFESNSDENHGHKKILLINKKPKPPLPSFIFLPNMNTAYYPPLGLPPPPVMPMYPIVPVPPMMPAAPLLTCPGHVPECDENKTASSTVAAVPTTSTEPKPTKADSDVTTTAISEATSTEAPAQRRQHRGRKRKNMKSLENIWDEDDESLLDFYAPNRDNRQKLIKLLRQRANHQRINDPSFKKQRKPLDKYNNQLTPPDTLMEKELPYDFIMNKNSSPASVGDTSDLENVDFKYLSQLIHRVNESQKDDPVQVNKPDDLPISNNPSDLFKTKYRDFNGPVDSGRRLHRYVSTSRNGQEDDSYYSNLGRQIATLIRTIDADKERQFNIEIENVKRKSNDHPYFNENSPRAFWERSVRSPLTLLHSFQSKFEDLKNSDELLFNMENKVETLASTAPTLSLQEIENMINIMETARKHFRNNNNMKNTQPSSKTLNVNLLPQELKSFKKPMKSSTKPKISNKTGRTVNSYVNTTRPKLLDTKLINVEKQSIYPFTNRDKAYKLNGSFIRRGSQLQPPTRDITKMHLQPMYEFQDQKTLRGFEKRPHTLTPTVLNYKNIKKYFFDNGNQYSFQNDELASSYSPASGVHKQQLYPLVSSPYFHHEISHVDYIS